MTKTAKRFAYFLNTRPLCFLSTVFGLRDTIIGLALVYPSDYRSTTIYSNLNALGGAAIYGWLLALIAFFVVVTAITDHTKFTQWGLRAMSWFWLFGAFSYALSGYWIFAAANLLMCCIPAGYIAFYYKYLPLWNGPKRRYRKKLGLS